MRQQTLAVVAAAILAGCAGTQDPTIPEPTTPTPEAPGDPARATPPAGPGRSGAERIEVTVVQGRVEGPGTVTVDVGTEIELSVTSDVADEVHVHGYDLRADVPAGGTAAVPFVADLPGVFEVELEERGLLLLELQVRG